MRPGALERIGDQLGVHGGDATHLVKQAEIDGGRGRAPRAEMLIGSRGWNGSSMTCGERTRS